MLSPRISASAPCSRPSGCTSRSRSSRTRSRHSAIAAILLLSSGLTGCAHVSRDAAASRQLYQPTVLRLPAGRPVTTLDGQHTPQVDEVWHSDARFRAVERQVIDTTAALAAERSRR